MSNFKFGDKITVTAAPTLEAYGELPEMISLVIKSNLEAIQASLEKAGYKGLFLSIIMVDNTDYDLVKIVCDSGDQLHDMVLPSSLLSMGWEGEDNNEN